MVKIANHAYQWQFLVITSRDKSIKRQIYIFHHMSVNL
jgi:hypothetical protein